MERDDIYIDQAMRNSNLGGGRRFFCAYTPHGVACIDTNFCIRIQNVKNKIKSISRIDRIKDKFIGTDGKEYESCMKYVDDLVLVDFEEWNKRRWGYEVEVIWETETGGENKHRFVHGDERPTYDIKTQKEDANTLIKDIKKNPHLHKEIKKNLLENLNNILTH